MAYVNAINILPTILPERQDVHYDGEILQSYAVTRQVYCAVS